MHVDGFRFDLAATLGREPHGFDQGSGFFDAVRQDPVLQRVKLIAEPWDIGPGGYQLGNFPPGWAELNDRFRDGVRQFWRGDEAMLPELAERLAGSAQTFDHRGRRPWATVNKITSHDGFTLNDLVSYDHKHNEANGEDNNDGHNANYSWNHGVEGPSDDPEIIALRERQMRNLLATLIFAQGTPMLLAGDEFARTQQGNNNAYCQDNGISWFDWEGIDAEGEALRAFTAKLIGLRKRFLALRNPTFLHGDHHCADGIADIAWFNIDGSPKEGDRWHDRLDRTVGLLLNGKAAPDAGIVGDDALIYMLFSAKPETSEARFPDLPTPGRWRRMVDTREPDAPDVILDMDDVYPLTGRTFAMFMLEPRPQEAEAPQAEAPQAETPAAATAPAAPSAPETSTAPATPSAPDAPSATETPAAPKAPSGEVAE
jgi:glycogen operon protein